MRRAAVCAVVLAVGLVVVGPPAAVAQERPGGRDRSRPALVDRLTNELTLTEDQLAKVKDLDGQRRERVRAAGEDAAKRREATEWFRVEVRKLLTEEQATKFDSLRVLRPRGARAPRRDFATQWKERLGLTDDQVVKIKALDGQRGERLRAADQDAAKRREAWQWYQREIRKLLTEDQRKKLDEAAARIRQRWTMAGLLGPDWALRGLELNEEQRKKVAGLRKERDKKVKAAFDAYMVGLKGVLTAEQIKKFEENLKRTPRPTRRPGGRGGRAGRGGEGRRERP